MKYKLLIFVAYSIIIHTALEAVQGKPEPIKFQSSPDRITSGRSVREAEIKIRDKAEKSSAYKQKKAYEEREIQKVLRQMEGFDINKYKQMSAAEGRKDAPGKTAFEQMAVKKDPLYKKFDDAYTNKIKRTMDLDVIRSYIEQTLGSEGPNVQRPIYLKQFGFPAETTKVVLTLDGKVFEFSTEKDILSRSAFEAFKKEALKQGVRSDIINNLSRKDFLREIFKHNMFEYFGIERSKALSINFTEDAAFYHAQMRSAPEGSKEFKEFDEAMAEALRPIIENRFGSGDLENYIAFLKGPEAVAKLPTMWAEDPKKYGVHIEWASER